MNDKPRTLAQNRALHMYFAELADELTARGLDMKRTLKPEIDIRWTGETVKEYIWRPIMKAQLMKQSTTEMTTKDIDAVLHTISRFMGEKFGITLPFPSMEELINESRVNWPLHILANMV